MADPRFYRPINDRQREMIRGMTGDPQAMSVPAPNLHIDSNAQDARIRAILQQHAIDSQSMPAEMPPEPPPARQFQQIQQKLQKPINSNDIRSLVSPTQALTPEQESELDRTRGNNG